MPILVALTVFFSWIVLINSLGVPFYLYYYRTVYLIYVSRLLDPAVWLVSSGLTVVLLAARTLTRSAPIYLSIAMLWLGVLMGVLMVLGAAPQTTTIAALATLVGCVLGTAVVCNGMTAKARSYFILVLLLMFGLLLLPIEVGSLSYYTLSAFRRGIDVGMFWETFEMQFWYTAFPLVPFLYAGFLFSWIWAPLVAKMRAKTRPAAGPEVTLDPNARTETRGWLGVIGCFALLATFLGYYPYFRDPSYPLVGTDIYWRYALPAERVVASVSWITAAARERHPLVVLGIAVASKFSGAEVEFLLRFAYVGLILVFGLATGALVFVGSRNTLLASVSALVSAVSVTATAGMYTGTIAEWIALIVWIVFLAILAVSARSLRRQLIPTCGLIVGSLLVLFIHPWTWIAMMVGLVAYCAIVLVIRPRGYVREIGPVLVVIFFNAAGLALSMFALLKTQGWRVASAFSLVQESLGSRYFGLGSWEILVFFSQIWSQFLNPVLLALSILGVVVLARRRDRLSWIVLAWIGAACVTNVLAAPMGYDPLDVNRGETQIFRAMFLTPFQVPAAIGLLHLKSSLDSRMGRSRRASVVVGLAIVLLFLAIVNGAFRALFPLLTDSHNYPNPLAP